MILFSLRFQSFSLAKAIPSSHHDGNLGVPILIPTSDSPKLLSSRKPSFNNAEECGFKNQHFPTKSSIYDPYLVDVAISLNVHYFRGSIASVHSIL